MHRLTMLEKRYSPPNPLREIDLSTMREGMHGERVSPSLDPREHAYGESVA